jgi:hypothetical protein
MLSRPRECVSAAGGAVVPWAGRSARGGRGVSLPRRGVALASISTGRRLASALFRDMGTAAAAADGDEPHSSEQQQQHWLAHGVAMVLNYWAFVSLPDRALDPAHFQECYHGVDVVSSRRRLDRTSMS